VNYSQTNKLVASIGILPTYLFRKSIYIVHGIWAIPTVLIMRLIHPFVLVRLGTFRSDRIGHFAADVGQRWALINSQKNNTIDWYWLEEETCNEQWAKMIVRNFSVYRVIKYLDLWNKFIPGGARHIRPSTTTKSRDIDGLLESSQRGMMDFLPSENQIAKTWLRKNGWTGGEKFVCLQVRDSTYLDSENTHPVNDWNYHNYRDSDIATYVSAVRWLLDQGIWVLRMGRVVEKRIPIHHPKMIDYAFSEDKSDFLDIWLYANCNLCITTLSGPDSVSDVYRRPLMAVNYLPLIDMYSWSNIYCHPKSLIDIESGKQLTLKESLNYQYYKTEDYENAGIEIINLTSSDILDSVKECWTRLEGKYVGIDGELEDQRTRKDSGRY
jgi:putative glycosyltransferase (TIGR04372 family)